MNKLVIATVAALSAGIVLAEEAPLVFGKPKRNPKMVAVTQKHNGGFIERADSFQGKLVVIDARATKDLALFSPVLASFTKSYKINAEIVGGKADAAKNPKGAIKAAGANVGVIVVEDDTTPQLLVAPDDGWAVVNVKPLVAGVEKSRLAPLRIQKETLRALGFVGGGMSSQYAQTLAGPIAKPSDLDGKEPLELPFDVIGACKFYLSAFGVTPYSAIAYRQAVKEGWAPKPTNEFQQKVWDEVRSVPKNPIKIEKK